MNQGELQRCRIFQLAAPTGTTGAPAQPPASSPPHVVMSPRSVAPDGPATGINWFLEAVTGETSGPFAVVVWKRDPTNLRWAKWKTVPVLPADAWVTFCDLNASELWWEVVPASIDDDARVLLHVEEIGA